MQDFLDNFINIGDKVNFIENGNTYSGKVIRKGSFVNSSTQNISVFTSIDDDKNSLYNGMYLSATIITKGIDNVCKLPRRAIFKKNKVFIINKNNELKIKEVNIISYQGDDVVVENLSNNTLIVNEPLVNINEGTIVKPISN